MNPLLVGEPKRETTPVATLGVTAILKLTFWPCVIFTVVPPFSERVVVDAVVGRIQL
jgi:hypothetical protein